MKQYFLHIAHHIVTVIQGMRLTLKHLVDARHFKKSVNIKDKDYFDGQRGIATIAYPHETIPVPDVGRYQLDCEIDDCIVCDQCVRICPVDCITIDSIKATSVFGKTSSGSPKRLYAAKFDIDMAKCCFCGLCTTVCPTECLIMTPKYDYSTVDLKDHLFSFANMTPEDIDARKREWQAMEETKKIAPTQNTKPSSTHPNDSQT